MKPRIVTIATTTAALAAVTWSAIALSAEPAHGERKNDQADEPFNPAVNKMEAAIRDVEKNLSMSAPMDIQIVNGVDPVEEEKKSGYIIDATLEEVEAAMAAAAATPSPEDDIQARILKHRGSYRFYVEE